MSSDPYHCVCNRSNMTGATSGTEMLPFRSVGVHSRCIRLDGSAARCSGRPKLPRQFVLVRNFEPRLFVPMPGNMGRPAFIFINLYIYCNLQRIIKKIFISAVCIYFLIRDSFVCLFVCWLAH